MLINGKSVTNLYFQEDVLNLTLDNYFDCLYHDYTKLIKFFEGAEYKKICLVKLEGQNPEQVAEGRHKFTGIQVSVCFMNREDESVYKTTSTVAKDIRIADIYSVHLCSYVCNVLSYRTGISWGTMPASPGVYSIAPSESINQYLENNNGN